MNSCVELLEPAYNTCAFFLLSSQQMVILQAKTASQSYMESLKEKTAKGLFWGALNNVLMQLIGVTMGIVLARLLNKADYGMMAMISVFALVANQLQNSGFKAALNNIKQPEHRDYNSVFWFNIAMGLGLYALLFLLAPLIARYYHSPELVSLSRYAFLALVFSSFGTAQSAYLAKNIMAKQVAKANLTSTLISSAVAVIMAWRGYAYWALATQTNLYVLLNTLLYWHYSHWRPTFGIDWQPVRRMFKFSSKLLFSAILTDINNNIMNILLGRYYSAASTGAYNQAYQWHSKAFFLIQGMLTQVAQPVLVDVGDEHERQLRVLRKMMRLAAMLSFPLLFGLGMVAHEFILVAITAKWAQSAEYMQLLCISGAFVPLSFLLSNLVISKGCSSTYLCVNLGLALAQVAAMVSLYPFGIRWMICALVVLNIACFGVWGLFARRLAGYKLRLLALDTLPFALAALAVMGITWFVTQSITALPLLLAARIALAAVLYLGIMKLANVDVMNEMWAFARRKKSK